MTVKKLTKTIVDALQSREGEYTEWCGRLPGFGCRVRPSGTKTYIAQYRIGGRRGKPRKVTIGAANKLTVEEARTTAANILAKAELGQDVAEELSRKRQQLTVDELCDEYLAHGCKHKKASTVQTDRSRIDRHIKPLLGRKKIDDVAQRDIRRFMEDVASGKSAVTRDGRSVVKGGRGAANRTVRLLGGIFTYAVEQGYIAVNPRFGVKVSADKKGERFLSFEEMKRLGETLAVAETVGLPWRIDEVKNSRHLPKDQANRVEKISPAAVAAIRLCLLTGCRRGEILNLRWIDVDFERGFLNLLDSKTGSKRVIVGPPVLDLLSALPRQGAYVIAGADPSKPRADLKRPWERITDHADLAGVRLHDLRHSFASVGAASGFGLATLGKILGHASPQTTSRYAHLADDPLRRATGAISEAIATALTGPPLRGKVADEQEG
jgi:integrase